MQERTSGKLYVNVVLVEGNEKTATYSWIIVENVCLGCQTLQGTAQLYECLGLLASLVHSVWVLIDVSLAVSES